MKATGYYLSLPFLYFIAILPFPIFYVVSDILSFVLHRIIKYRIDVVRQNLSISFPEKSTKELRQIEKKFYKYIVDFALETLKCLKISKEELKKRISLEGSEVLQNIYEKDKNIIVLMGHYGNYEWANQAMPLFIPFIHKFVYKPLKNEFFDKLIYDFRTQYGGVLVPMAQSFKEIKKVEERPFSFFLINDQSAPPDRAYWTTFLNQETSFFTGAERFARQYNMPVFYMTINRKKRGFYQMRFELITENPNALEGGAIIEAHTRKLERDIKADPSIWFWSHKRWKYKKVNGEYVDMNY